MKLPELVVLSPTRQTLASKVGDQTFCRMGEVIADTKGGAYFNDDTPGIYYVNAAGKVSLVAGKEVNTNGLILSPDEKTFYSTNGKTIVAFDVQPDGTTKNQRTFVTLEGGANGDGMCIDSAGRLYVTAGDTGIQVFSPRRKVPWRHSSATVCFELRVFRTRQEGALREGCRHDRTGRQRV